MNNGTGCYDDTLCIQTCCKYQFLFAFIVLIYSGFTIIPPAFMTFLSIVLLSCNVFGSGKIDSIKSNCGWTNSIYLTIIFNLNT